MGFALGYDYAWRMNKRRKLLNLYFSYGQIYSIHFGKCSSKNQNAGCIKTESFKSNLLYLYLNSMWGMSVYLKAKYSHTQTYIYSRNNGTESTVVFKQKSVSRLTLIKQIIKGSK